MARFSRFSNQINNFRKNYFEQQSWAQNQVVCGIDEVGRSCLAGPLVTAAVILPIGKAPSFLKDSKVMTLPERLRAHTWITRHCQYSYGIVNHRVVDAHNIYYATLIAMKKALVHLLSQTKQAPQAILVDAMPLNLGDTGYKDIPVHYFPFGERKSSSIAAASIIAKVTRDRLMEKFDVLFPGYNLKDHKGYGTPEHRERVKELSSSIIHRRTYIARLYERIALYDKQTSIASAFEEIVTQEIPDNHIMLKIEGTTDGNQTIF